MPGWRKCAAVERVALVGTAILALGRVATAEPESVRIDYMAPAGCPDATVFLRALRERTTHWRDATPDEQARRFLVRVTPVGRSFSGRLEIRGPGGSSAVRRVDGTTCDEVSSALTLMTALAIDPKALTSGPKAALERPAEPPAELAAESDRQPLSPSEVAVAARPPSASQSAAQPWRWSVGLLGNMTFGVAPTLGYGADLFVDAEAPASSTLGPAVRMGIFLNQCDVEFPTAAARFQWAAAAVEGCPVRLGLMDLRLTIHPCLAFRLGVLRGEGRRISQPNQTISVWSDAGPVLRLRFAVTARLILEAQGALVLPLHRPTFEITDLGSPTTVYSVPRVGGSAGIGVAYRFR